MRSGVISDPPPTPVMPTRKPTKKPDRTKRGWMVSNRAISLIRFIFAGQGPQSNTKQVQIQSNASFAQLLGSNAARFWAGRPPIPHFLTLQSRSFPLVVRPTRRIRPVGFLTSTSHLDFSVTKGRQQSQKPGLA